MAVTPDQSGFAQAQPVLAAFVGDPRLPDAVKELQAAESAVAGPGGDLRDFFVGKGFDLPPNVTVRQSAEEGSAVLFGVCVEVTTSIYCLEFTIPTAE